MTVLLIGLGGAIAVILATLRLLPTWLEARHDARTVLAKARMLRQTGQLTDEADSWHRAAARR
jgi:hypothetical protein